MEQCEEYAEQCRADEQTEKSECEEASEDTEENQGERHSRPKTHQPRTNDIIDGRDEQAPDNHEYAPPRTTYAEKPPGRAAPDYDQQYPELAQRDKQGDKAQEPRSRNTCNYQPNRHSDRLHRRRTDNSVSNPSHRVRCHLQRCARYGAAQALGNLLQCFCQSIAAKPQHSCNSKRHEQLEHAFGERACNLDQRC